MWRQIESKPWLKIDGLHDLNSQIKLQHSGINGITGGKGSIGVPGIMGTL